MQVSTTVVVELPSHVWFFVASWTRAHQASLYRLLEFVWVRVHLIGDAIQLSHSLLAFSPSAFDLSQHLGLVQWISCSNQVDKVLELQLQHWGSISFRIDWFNLHHCSLSIYWPKKPDEPMELLDLASSLCEHHPKDWVSLVAQIVKNRPAVWETRLLSLGQEDPLEKWMATHCSILAWRSQWTEKPGRLQSMRSQGVRHKWMTNTTLLYIYIYIYISNPISNHKRWCC